VRRAPRPAPCRRLALRLLVRHDARCVRPTSAFSRSSYEHPRLVGSRCVMRLRACAIEDDRLLHISEIRFGGPHVCRGFTAVGVVFPSRCVRSVPLASLSPPPLVSCRSRDLRTRGSRRDRPQPDRVNDAGRTSNPRCLPSSETPCPATPSRAPGSGLSRFAAWPPQPRFSTPLHPRESLRTLGSWAPVHAPRCQRETRFSEPRCRLSTSAT